ncbi:uncharacterized protein GIQ15_06337 [Arthroderma uncinatum]|uniref:uncharacterized protein n=1 Tax=Arthroderma uncinatum TaxID=74035 RepID=UPI00144A9503|nr:uncharacterized protein GIQ15_06337 [Arthroderma uncinatum]KAF3480990.1 hypothetical protein GIQ15_06337 [Arthroderma uncinatum]
MKLTSIVAIAVTFMVSGLAIASPDPIADPESEASARGRGFGGLGRGGKPGTKGAGVDAHRKGLFDKKCIPKDCNAMCIRDGYQGGVCLKNAGIEGQKEEMLTESYFRYCGCRGPRPGHGGKAKVGKGRGGKGRGRGREEPE